MYNSCDDRATLSMHLLLTSVLSLLWDFYKFIKSLLSLSKCTKLLLNLSNFIKPLLNLYKYLNLQSDLYTLKVDRHIWFSLQKDKDIFVKPNHTPLFYLYLTSNSFTAGIVTLKVHWTFIWFLKVYRTTQRFLQVPAGLYNLNKNLFSCAKHYCSLQRNTHLFASKISSSRGFLCICRFYFTKITLF